MVNSAVAGKATAPESKAALVVEQLEERPNLLRLVIAHGERRCSEASFVFRYGLPDETAGPPSDKISIEAPHSSGSSDQHNERAKKHGCVLAVRRPKQPSLRQHEI